ncbi:glycoside hydrolase family 10 protein [Candidatus Epulonipiscium viviparus]|uniref:glycoside hydrolase family 10 protein n=1 Tax=Candidatus Epulonipiscium viviparus TaxID=420336 RepID=UPI0027381602|nr:family 10 glycosylhydrolase [Candidatus Epulopiscium viviparus]
MKGKLFLLTSLLTVASSMNIYAKDEPMRGIWISTVANIDFPKNIGDPLLQQEEMVNYLDELKEVGINAVMFQVRPTADALYESKINPYSNVLTGVQGKNPGYDPLEFTIKEAHKRDIEVHAWLNPYRVSKAGLDFEDLAVSHPARLDPSMIFVYNDAMYYNPELEIVKVHIENTIEEIIRNYDVDGIHFDDYFYPAGYPLPEGENGDGKVAEQRRYNVNDMVKRVSELIKEIDSDVEFGISPMGIWKNDLYDISGSATNGGQAYYDVYADARMWIKNEWIDYIVPQIYWEQGHKAADYETLVSWWNNEVLGTDVDLYIGQALYKDVVAKEIVEQLDVNKKYNEVDGSVFFTLDDLLEDREGSKGKLTEYFAK